MFNEMMAESIAKATFLIYINFLLEDVGKKPSSEDE